LLLLGPVPHRTDFGCCHDPKEQQQNLASSPLSTKVGGCDWTFTLLQEDLAQGEPDLSESGLLNIKPVVGSTWLKFGPASGVW
jgi:hypothetical protein